MTKQNRIKVMMAGITAMFGDGLRPLPKRKTHRKELQSDSERDEKLRKADEKRIRKALKRVKNDTRKNV